MKKEIIKSRRLNKKEIERFFTINKDGKKERKLIKKNNRKSMSKVNIEMSVDDLLSSWGDESKDCLRDFMTFMKMGYDEDKHQKLYNEKIDEVEYYKRVFNYYIYKSIQNHHLLNMLIDDRKGKLGKPISDISVDFFLELINNYSRIMYNDRVLRKGIVIDKIKFNTNF